MSTITARDIFRLLTQLPLSVANKMGEECPLTIETDAAHPSRKIVLCAPGHRTWLVHVFPSWHFVVYDEMLYRNGIEIEGTWRERMFERLVKEGIAERIDRSPSR